MPVAELFEWEYDKVVGLPSYHESGTTFSGGEKATDLNFLPDWPDKFVLKLVLTSTCNCIQ